VRACVDSVKALGAPLDAVICNAGIMALPKLEQAFGIELQFFTNHIGHFVLVTGLLESLTPGARLVILSSSAHASAPKGGIEFDNLSGEKHYDGWKAYGQSKVANLLFAKELARRYPQWTANAVHPGVIKTNLTRSMNPIAGAALKLVTPIGLKSVEEGAATECFVATHPSLAGVTGEYFADCNVARSSRTSRDPELAARLWEESEKIVARLPQ
jgi:NAD(P)-dependent dehydrogenase (short-subunit alcohol dehydrogenase family)